MAESALSFPWSNSTVSVSVIDTTMWIAGLPPTYFMGPQIEGFDALNSVAYSFLITHDDGTNVVFDLGAPKNYAEDLPPAVAAQIDGWGEAGVEFNIDLYVSEILRKGCVDLDTIDAVIWSHTHWDHIGKPSLFPSSTDLILGPGTLDFFGAGYPLNETSPYRARELEGRDVKEIEFADDATRIGGLQSYDYFGDGSFYLLATPGHEVGQLNGLARVTKNPDTFILLGADTYHHGSQIRPSEHVPLPDSINLFQAPESFPNPLRAELLFPIHPSTYPESLPEWASNLTSPITTPYQAISDESPFHRYPPIARDVVSKLQVFDADDNVLIITAHDTSLTGIIDFFPKKANDWKAKGWKEDSRWQFFTDFEGALDLSTCDS